MMRHWDNLLKSFRELRNQENKHMWALSGGKFRDKVPIYRGLPLKKPEEMAKEANAWRSV